jgi:hypothetical protein
MTSGCVCLRRTATRTPGRQLGVSAELPVALAEEESLNPFRKVAERARGRLETALPAVASREAEFPFAAFGLTSGFFYVTSAQGRAWGMPDGLVADVLTTQALGHFHFAFHDAVIDEGKAPAVMCLLSDACLLSYLDGLAAMAPERVDDYKRLHRDYYNLYAAAISRDLAHRDELHAYAADDILGLGDKAAPGATMFHLVADLAGRPNCAEPAALALLRLCTGLQLVDDLNDSADDAPVQNRTWPVTSALLAYPDLDVTDRRAVEAAVVGSGAASGCLRLAMHAFSDALVLARRADAAVLAELASTWHDRTVSRARRLQETLGVA